MRHRLHLSRFVLAAALVAAHVRRGRRPDRPRRRHGQGRKRSADQRRDRHRRKSQRVAEQLHRDDRRQRPLLDHRPARRQWTFTAQAPGFAPESGKLNVQTIGAPNPPLTFTLKKAASGAGRCARRRSPARISQAELAAADAHYNAGKCDDAIAEYRAIMTKAPALSVINLQIAAAYRNKKEYDKAIAAYNDLLKTDPNNDKAIVGIGMTNLEKGDLKAAEETLRKAAESPKPTPRGVLQPRRGEVRQRRDRRSGEVVSEGGRTRPSWGKPLFKLGLVAAEQGRQGRDDQDAREGDRASIPTSPEAAQAKTVIEQLKK